MRITQIETDLPFNKALYSAQCGECGETLDWEADLDADGTTYYAICCELRYFMRNKVATIVVAPYKEECG